MEKEKPLSRMAKFGRQYQTSKGIRQDEGATPADSINLRHTMMIGLIVTALIYMFNFASELERNIFEEHLMDWNVSWNIAVYVIKGVVCSMMIPIALYLLHVMLYFIQDTRYALTQVKESYHQVLRYGVLCVLLGFIMPMVIVYLLHPNEGSIVSYGILLLVLLFIITAYYVIVPKVSTHPHPVKGMWIYIVSMLIFILGFSLYPSTWNQWFPSITVAKHEFYASQDHVAMVGFTGKVEEAYLVRSPYTKEQGVKNGIRLRELDGQGPYHQFLIDFTDPRITAASYDIVISYQDTGLSTLFGDTKERPLKTMTQRISYLFDGSETSKEAYVGKYIALFKRVGTPSGMTTEVWGQTLTRLANTLRYSHYDGWNPNVQSQYMNLKKILPASAQDILAAMMSDPVLSPIKS
ncbi:hypothetical protein BVG16_25920 [Paenibacillus selenitireducens]|uniref:Uncharacterized protein n=1 Tax=Paenibacillus selenitireducens TaxID=1324314 RepID=A0A1T2X1W5_9BACL|nr:hypothetical protein [Paenibacillus selenitireducens]OPA73881.1 hypothetical protein BVG16_25920 [Paenibacillus selenitireducens]